MPTPAKHHIPEGYHSITPYLVVRGAARAIEFYKRAFDAAELMRMKLPDGRVGHAELRIGSSVVMLADEMPEQGHKGPQTYGGTTAGMLLYVRDCDATIARAVAAGAQVERPAADQFYGDRSGTVRDPFGHRWMVSTHKELLTPEEMAQRMAKEKQG